MQQRSWRRVRDMWRFLSTSESAFPHEGVVVVAAEHTWLSPRGSVGVVLLGDTAVVATPPDLLGRVEAPVAGSIALAATLGLEPVARQFSFRI